MPTSEMDNSGPASTAVTTAIRTSANSRLTTPSLDEPTVGLLKGVTPVFVGRQPRTEPDHRPCDLVGGPRDPCSDVTRGAPLGVFMSKARSGDNIGEDMTSETRIPPTEITGAYGALVKFAARKMVGRVPDSIGVLWHNQAVMKDTMGIGRKVEGWRELDPDLASLCGHGVGGHDRLQLLPRPELLHGAQPRTRRGEGPRGAPLARVVRLHRARAQRHGVRGRREPDAARGDRRAVEWRCSPNSGRRRSSNSRRASRS